MTEQMSAPERAPLHVLVVEDEPDHVVLVTHAIRAVAPRTTVRSASDSDQALALLGAADPRPDLILLDINLPGRSGFDVLSWVKGDAALSNIPVVMLTSSELPSDVARAYELGAGGYISKQSYLHDLQTVMSNTLLYWSAMMRASA